MAHSPSERAGFLVEPAAWVLAALVAIRVVVLLVIVARAGAIGGMDADVGRAFRLATSPAVPYRGFPVEFMPVQTAVDRAIAGGTIAAATIRIALVAFVADLVAATAMWRGWGRRVAATYLVCGLPLLGFIYLRFDLVSVALAAWALAFLHRREQESAGAALGLAVMAKLWPLAVAPVFALRKARRGLVVAAAVCLVIGGWWYLTGGAKGPFQVLTLRNTRGWHIESVVGSVLWAFGRGSPYREADAMRIGDVATWAKGLLFVGLLIVEAMLWRRASRDRRDPAGAATLAAVAALAVFAPILSLQAAAWLLPFAALALEGDHDERHTAGVAAVAIALTGVIALLWRDHAAEPAGWLAWVVLLRNLVWIDIVVSWLRIPMLAAEPGPTARPRRRSADRATEGIEAVLPFDVE
jgi:hypothetical protein